MKKSTAKLVSVLLLAVVSTTSHARYARPLDSSVHSFEEESSQETEEELSPQEVYHQAVEHFSRNIVDEELLLCCTRYEDDGSGGKVKIQEEHAADIFKILPSLGDFLVERVTEVAFTPWKIGQEDVRDLIKALSSIGDQKGGDQQRLGKWMTWGLSIIERLKQTEGSFTSEAWGLLQGSLVVLENRWGSELIIIKRERHGNWEE